MDWLHTSRLGNRSIFGRYIQKVTFYNIAGDKLSPDLSLSDIFYPKIQFPKTPNTYFRLELLLELSIEMFFSDLVDRVKGDFPEQ